MLREIERPPNNGKSARYVGSIRRSADGVGRSRSRRRSSGFETNYSHADGLRRDDEGRAGERCGVKQYSISSRVRERRPRRDRLGPAAKIPTGRQGDREEELEDVSTTFHKTSRRIALWILTRDFPGALQHPFVRVGIPDPSILPGSQTISILQKPKRLQQHFCPA